MKAGRPPRLPTKKKPGPTRAGSEPSPAGTGGSVETLTDHSIDIEKLIDARKLGGLQLLVIVLCGCALLVDGFDTLAIGYVAPAIVKAWHINRSAMTPTFAAGQVGLLLGSLLFGPVADKIGRRPVMMLCSIAFGLLTLLTMSASSITEFMVLRFLTGLGLGGAMPNALALTSEYVPARIRITTTMIMFSTFSIGAALGGICAATLIADHGWQAVFLVGGIIPLVLAAVLWLWMPESLRYLALTRRNAARLTQLVRRIAPDAIPAGSQPVFVVTERKAAGLVVRELFTEGRAKVTLLLWVVTFASLLDLNLLSNWLPTMLKDSGLSLQHAALITVGYQVGGTAGSLLLGRFFDRYSPFQVLVLTYLLAFVAIFSIGFAGANFLPLAVTVFVAGFCVIGGICASDALTATCYPTGVRVTGLGWAIGIGRLGAIFGPTIGGIGLGMGWSGTTFFAIGAVPILGAAAAAWALHGQTRHILQPQPAIQES
jgi:AAHS family 4-hydroxybenzoate transporter-like MFS transporter